MPTYWDQSKAIYRDGKGKEIPYPKVRGYIEAVADDSKKRLTALTEQLIKDKDIASWYTQAEPIIRRSLISAGQIASGGKAQVTASLNGRIGAAVKFHLQKFKDFSLEIEAGTLTEAQTLARVAMYGDATVGVFEVIRDAVMQGAGYTEAKNILGDAAHCGECPSIIGWIPIADYKPPGSRECLTRCRCSTEYR